MGRRQCAYCGAFVDDRLTQCPVCRESLGAAVGAPPQVEEVPASVQAYIRRGLLYMLMAAVIYYFAGANSPLPLPFAVHSALTSYLLPLLFFSGLGLTGYGFVRKMMG